MGDHTLTLLSQDTILNTLLVSPSIPEDSLDIWQHTCSQLLSDDAWLTDIVDPPNIRRLFNVLVNIGNLMHRIDNAIPMTTQCYMHAFEVAIQKPNPYYPRHASKVAFRDVIVAAWATAMALPFTRTASISPSTRHALAFAVPVNILARIGDPNFDVLQAVHDAGDDLIRLLIDPTTGTLPNIILFPDQIHQLSTFILSSHNGYLSPIQAAQFPADLSDEQYCQESKMALASVLLCLARRFQTSHTIELFSISEKPFCTAEALTLVMHYLAASLFPNASTMNDIGVILCGLGSGEVVTSIRGEQTSTREVARLYYEKGLQLDPSHPHLLSNLGSLLKDAGHMTRAIGCAPKFSIISILLIHSMMHIEGYSITHWRATLNLILP